MRTKVAAGLTALMLAGSLVLAGCSGGGSGDSQAELIGKWNWARLTINGITLDRTQPNGYVPGGSTTITPATIAQLIPGASASMTVTFNEDKTTSGTFNVTIPRVQRVSQTLTGTWNTSGDTLTLNLVDQGKSHPLSCTYVPSGSSLTLAMSNAQLLAFLSTSGANLPPAQLALARTLSGSAEFTR